MSEKLKNKFEKRIQAIKISAPENYEKLISSVIEAKLVRSIFTKKTMH